MKRTSHQTRSPEEKTLSLVTRFGAAAESIYQVTRPVELSTFEKGVYAHLFVKPIRRIARLLTLDREILILFSTFEDQQPRTIEMAMRTIADEGTRLEHNVAIIVHCDSTGNMKLKNWGREQSISIIPIYAGGNIPSGDELEKLLFAEFYSHDSFDVTGPVSDDSRFYGRRSEAQELARQLQTGQVRACLGLRKTGKTSIINRIVDVLAQSHDCHSLMIDCSKDSIWTMDEAKFIESIALSLAAAIQENRQYGSLKPTRDPADLGDATDHLCTVLATTKKPVIIFFDEIDYITPGSPTAKEWGLRFNPLWRNLRVAYQETKRSGIALSFFVSGVSSKWFKIESIFGVENSALAFLPEEYLCPLATAASASMIKSLSKTCGLTVDTGIAQMIAEECSNIPFWIRKACSYIHRNIPSDNRPYTIKHDEVRSFVESFIESEGSTIVEVALNHLFRVFPELEGPVEQCHRGMIKDVPVQFQVTLEKYGLLTRRGGSLSLSGRMMQQGLELYLAKRAPAVPQPGNSVAFGSTDEWADELALCNAQRNRLEKRLRYLVLNFLRVDLLQSKKSERSSLQVRILMVIDSEKREAMKHNSADEVIDKFFWADLVKLILREWPLFEPLFVDKREFESKAEAVNRRYDAHAKDADRLDIFAYRTALTWLEEKLSRV